MLAFEYTGSPARIIFGAGAIDRAAEAISDLGRRRAVLLATPFQARQAAEIAARIGDAVVGIHAEAVMHTPIDVTERAVEHVKALEADCLVSFGGGSTIGLGKAISIRTGLAHVAIPTTYAGSEATPILGETRDGVKTTRKDARILPGVVIYDPDFTLTLPAEMTVNSALNAIAHAVEALYAQDRNPISSLMAEAGIRALVEALPILRDRPADADARAKAMYGAWLCGTVLGTVGMALHHKLCHTLGGAFDLPHAETHAIILPHAAAFNAAAVPDLLAPVASILGADSVGRGLHAYARSIGAPVALKDLGMPESGIAMAADLATRNAYWNPRPFERADIHALLEAAWHGRAPAP